MTPVRLQRWLFNRLSRCFPGCTFLMQSQVAPDATTEDSDLSPQIWPFHLVRIVLGLLLVTAAFLKFQDYSVDGLARSAFLWSARLYVAVIAVEAGQGLWLLSGHAPRALWFAACFLFLGLAGVSLYLIYLGQPSCGCFGKLKVSPWYSFTLDLLAVAALAFCRRQVFRRRGDSVSLSTVVRQSLPVAVGAAVIIAISLGVLTGIYGSPSAALTTLRGESVTVDPPVSDLGAGPRGESLTLTIRLTNHTTHPVRIVGGSSDCSCLTTGELPILL